MIALFALTLCQLVLLNFIIYVTRKINKRNEKEKLLLLKSYMKRTIYDPFVSFHFLALFFFYFKRNKCIDRLVEKLNAFIYIKFKIIISFLKTNAG